MIARNYQRRTALTIMELLVSVSILTLLAPLLLPALLQARAMARRIAQNNQRQWGLFVSRVGDDLRRPG
jgi:type II secretory pathway pseudopilin PulG